jgi:hypothetical protein
MDLAEVDYEGTMSAKLGLARKVFDRVGEDTLNVSDGDLAVKRFL